MGSDGLDRHAPFLLALHDRLDAIEDPATLANVACATIAALGALPWVMLARVDGSFCRGTVAGVWPETAAAARAGALEFDLLAPETRDRLAAGRTVVVGPPHAGASDEADATWASLVCAEATAMLLVPVLVDGRLSAMLLAGDAGPRDWCAERSMLTQAAPRCWRAFARAEAHADLRRSEHEHRMAVALCPQLFWTATPDGGLDDMGPIFSQLTSRRRDQCGFGWRQTTHPDDLPEVERAVAHCMATGDTYDIEHRTIGDDGRPRWVHVHARPVRGPGGTIERWFGTITDIDRRKRAELALKASEDRFLRAIAGARVGTWDWDMGTDEVVTSPGFATQFHDLPEGSIRSSRDFLNAIHPEDRDRLAAILAEVSERARRNGSAEYEAEYRVVRGDGEVRWLGAQGNVTISPGNGFGGRLSGLTVDMSERRRAEQMLTQTQDTLRTLNADLEAEVRREVAMREHTQSLLAQARRMEALGQLAGGIAHDFNNVLQAVIGGLDLLRLRASQPDAVRTLAARTAEAAARGTAITGRLLAFARRSDLQTVPIAPVPVLEGLRDMLAPTLGVGVSLQVAVVPGVPDMLADRAQLETVLVNLAVNARDAMPEGGTLRITARTAAISGDPPAEPDTAADLREGNYVVLALEDTGTGMSAEVLARATEPFFTTKPLGQGTGLGLAMARGFAEQSGGALFLSSLEGRGTTVELWFPAHGKAPGPADGPPDAEPDRRHILVVDDDGLVRSMLAAVIAEMGYAVTEAAHGREALEQLHRSGKIDLVVSDYAMPGMNGAALAAAIRAQRPRLPIVMITGHVDDTMPVGASGGGTDITLLLRKPLSSAALCAAISSLLDDPCLDS